MSKIVITGVTGQFGGFVVSHLLTKGVNASQIRGVARDPQKATKLTELGIEIVQGDYDDPTSLLKAFSGASKLLFISASSLDNTLRVRQHASVVEAARNSGVGQIAYTGCAFPEQLKLGLENVHLATEYMIRATNLPYTFLRNTFYLEILVNESLKAYLAQGEIVSATGNGKMNFVTRNDLALAAAEVLVGEGHENKIYELVNPNPFTYDEFAAFLSEVAGQTVKHRVVSSEEVVADLVKGGMPAARAGFLVNLVQAAIKNGQFSSASEDLLRLIGSSYTSPKEAIRRILK